MVEKYRPIVGELDGRLRMPLRKLPQGTVALTVPRTGGGGPRAPKNRGGHLSVREVDLVAEDEVPFYEPPDGLSDGELVWILKNAKRSWATVEKKFGPRAGNVALALVRAGGVILRCSVHDLVLRSPKSWRLAETWAEHAPDAIAALQQLRDPDEVRAELVAMLKSVRPDTRLYREREALERVPFGAPLRVPAGSVTNAPSWSPYEKALRAAAIYVGMGRRPTDAELAVRAWGDTKVEWTAARQRIFAELVGVEFIDAVTVADVGIRVRGPLRWQESGTIVDALKARPWITMPLKGMRFIGKLENRAEGVFIVENADTFQEVAAIESVTDRWLCVWGQGKAVVRFAELVSENATLPVAVWMDLDAEGLGIVKMFQDRLKRPVIPLGMSLDLLLGAEARRNSKKDMTAEDMKLAASLVGQLPPSLTDVAEHIARTGKAVEQQALHDIVLPGLPAMLRALEPRSL